MPDRVVALQLLTSYWFAVILPPLPGIYCFTAIYHNEHHSNVSPYSHQGRKFGGYKILPKMCKDTSSSSKETTGVCMFNYECTHRGGTVVGTCMDGFLYGACCHMPQGTAVSTFDLPPTTTPKTVLTPAIIGSTSPVKPHIEHSPEETVLLYKNGTVVENVYSPDDFLYFTKQQKPFVRETSPIPSTEYNSNNAYETDYSTIPQDGVTFSHIPNNISPSQIFDLAVAATSKPPITDQRDRSSTSYTTKRFSTTASSREPFSPNFSSVKFSTHYTTPKPVQPITTNKATEFFSHNSKYGTTTTPNYMYTNKNEVFDDDENLIRVPTLTADSVHKYGQESINHLLWLLNDTKRPDIEAATQATQPFYTWLSVQDNPDKSSTYYTKPVTPTNYFENVKPSTALPSTTVHHIPGPSFLVTPEVKITPKPQTGVSESVPTVIVLTSAQDITTTRKPPFSYTTSSNYNVSYSFPQTTNKPTTVNKPTYSSKPYVPSLSTEKPVYSKPILITAKPSQTTFGSFRPPTAGYISKPIYADAVTSIKPVNPNVYTNLPATSTNGKPIKSTHISSTLQSSTIFSNVKPQSHNTLPTTSPPIYSTTAVVTTAKPITNNQNDQNMQPVYSEVSIPSFSNAVPAVSTSSYVTIKPSTSSMPGVTSPLLTTYDDTPPYPFYPGAYPGANIIINSTEDFAFPPVRDPNVNLTATQQEKPILTATTTFGDEETDSEVTPQFVVDKTLEDKVHVFVEKIVQSLQGNFEDLEKVLLTGESTGNVTIANASPTKKPTTVSKRPVKKPVSSTTSKPAKPQKQPSLTTLPVTSTVTKKPSRKPTLATPVVLFQPSTPSTSSPTRKPIKITSTTITITTEAVSPSEADEIITTSKDTLENQESIKRECGIRPMARKNGRIVGGKGSTFGEWPWQVLVREATWLGLFTKNKCGGVLITSKYVITAAHCQPGFLANLVAVFGEFDISGEVESKRSIGKNVRRVIVHRQYDAATFENDIALLELESPIQFDTHIVPICMPEDDEDFTGRMATVTGWGRLKYGGGVPSILQEVQVPVIENRVCQEMFQTAGHSKVILSSFMCAGYANGQKDSCEGDSGGPLMVERDDGRWVLVATVSHGIKCAAPYLPGVYMRTTYYKPWLQTITGV